MTKKNNEKYEEIPPSNKKLCMAQSRHGLIKIAENFKNPTIHKNTKLMYTKITDFTNTRTPT